MPHRIAKMINRQIVNVIDWFDERVHFKETILVMMEKPFSKHATDIQYCFGGISLLLFLNQVVTGLLLSVYYVPTPKDAYLSIQYITFDVNFGWLIRALHIWGADLMVLCVLIHLCIAYFKGYYRKPLELNWVSGFILFVLCLAFGFSGYLLPWTQLSYWATTIVTDMTTAIPYIGDFVLLFLRGGKTVDQATLVRFYSFHTQIIPSISLAVLFFHLWMIKRRGICVPL